MGFLINAVSAPKKIEYARAILEPKKYNPEEAIDIANFSAGGSLWAEFGVSTPPSMDFLRQLARGGNPVTGGRLTARKHAKSEQQHPTSFYSGVYNVPKSISAVSELGGDKRLRREVLTAARLIMQLIEHEFSGFRSRKKGAINKNNHCSTGSMAYILYLENDSRYGDPNVHIHVFIFNVTKDPSDPKKPFKAFSAIALFRAQKLLSKLFHEQLEQGVQKLGYDTVECPQNGAFEITGIPRSLIDKFSKGHQAIKRAASDHPKEKRGATAAKRERGEWEAEVALKIRPKKKKETQSQLQARWRSELTLDEERLLDEVVHRARFRSLSPAQPKLASLTPVGTVAQSASTFPFGNYFPAAELVLPTDASVPWEANPQPLPLSFYLSAATPDGRVSSVSPSVASPSNVHSEAVVPVRVVPNVEPELPEI